MRLVDTPEIDTKHSRLNKLLSGERTDKVIRSLRGRSRAQPQHSGKDIDAALRDAEVEVLESRAGCNRISGNFVVSPTRPFTGHEEAHQLPKTKKRTHHPKKRYPPHAPA